MGYHLPLGHVTGFVCATFNQFDKVLHCPEPLVNIPVIIFNEGFPEYT